MGTRDVQKERTRERILHAVGTLLDRGCADPTVDEITGAAGVSRATFYRYFGSPSEALWHVFTDRRLPAVEETFAGAGSPIDRIARAEEAVNGYLFADPMATRAYERGMLSRTIDGTATPLDRPARRLTYIDAALAPIADILPADERSLVRHALALTMGSSVVPALMDTCGLSAGEARRVAQYTARVIVQHAEALATAASTTSAASTASTANTTAHTTGRRAPRPRASKPVPPRPSP